MPRVSIFLFFVLISYLGFLFCFVQVCYLYMVCVCIILLCRYFYSFIMVFTTLSTQVLGSKQMLLSPFERQGYDAQRDEVTCLRSHTKLMVKWELKANPLDWCPEWMQLDCALSNSQAPKLQTAVQLLPMGSSDSIISPSEGMVGT